MQKHETYFEGIWAVQRKRAFAWLTLGYVIVLFLFLFYFYLLFFKRKQQFASELKTLLSTVTKRIIILQFVQRKKEIKKFIKKFFLQKFCISHILLQILVVVMKMNICQLIKFKNGSLSFQVLIFFLQNFLLRFFWGTKVDFD